MGMLRRKHFVYVLVAVSVTVAMASALGLVLFSGIRHLLWLRAMGGGHSSVAFWLQSGVALSLTLLFWYRIFIAALRLYQHGYRLEKELGPHLMPLNQSIPDDIQDIATWYCIENQQVMAFTWGVLRPRIALSTGLYRRLDESAQRAVMYHEAAHVRMHDSLQQAILLVLSNALGPLGLRALYQRYLIHREILADDEALQAVNGDDVPLLSALLAVVKSEDTAPSSVASYVGLAGVMEARLKFIETGLSPRFWDRDIWVRLAASLMAVGLAVGQGLLVWCH